ncbi:hypothetical protein LCGC14_1123370, partial [marine sediment metagenome]
KKDLIWNKALTPKMKQFKEETGKNPVYRGKITGGFEYWMYWRKPKVTKPKPKFIKKPIKKPVKPKKEIKTAGRKIIEDEIYQNHLQKIEKCKENPGCSKFSIHNLQGHIVEDYKHGDISQEKAQKLMKYAQKVYDNKVKEEIMSKSLKTKSKIKVIIHLPYGKSEDLILTINFMSSKVKNESKKDIQNIIDDKWSDKYMYNPKGHVYFKHLTFTKDGDIYLRYEINSVEYDTRQDLDEIFDDLAKMIYKNSKLIPTGIRITAHYSENWIKRYKNIKVKIDSLSPYERIIIKELEYTDSYTKLALVRELKQKYPKSRFSMITFSRYSSNLIKKQYVEYTGLTTGGLGRIKLTKEGKLIKELLLWR